MVFFVVVCLFVFCFGLVFYQLNFYILYKILLMFYPSKRAHNVLSVHSLSNSCQRQRAAFMVQDRDLKDSSTWRDMTSYGGRLLICHVPLVSITGSSDFPSACPTLATGQKIRFKQLHLGFI